MVNDLVAECSPRVRGWSHGHGLDVVGAQVLPARAGVVPGIRPRRRRRIRAPRRCGVGPWGCRLSVGMSAGSLRVRDWSRSGQRNQMPRTPRIWSKPHQVLRRLVGVSLAAAGTLSVKASGFQAGAVRQEGGHRS